MKSDKDIEAWIRSTDPNTHSSMDEQLLEHMLEARPARQQGRDVRLWPLNHMPILRGAAILLLVLGIGFGVGRVSVPSAEALKTSLEQSLKTSLKVELQGLMRQEMVLLMREALGEFTAQTRTACQSYTEQRLRDLVQLIDRTRAEDRRYAAAAFERMEIHRQQDKDLLKQGIVALTLQTQDRPVREIN